MQAHSARAWRATPIAQSRHADVYVWSDEQLIACFNADTVGSVTARTLLRWLHLAVIMGDDEMEIRRVVFQTRNMLHYPRTPLEPLKLSEVLTPGDYACYYLEPPGLAPRAFKLPRGHLQSIAERFLPALAERRADQQAQDTGTATFVRCTAGEEEDTPPRLRAYTAAMDSKCIFTGSMRGPFGDESVETRRIISPEQRDEIEWLELSAIDLGGQDFSGPTNEMTMRSDVYRLWSEYAFSVDVDDNHKVQFFDEAATTVGLPARLNGANPHSDVFLREHFRYTLAARILGGHLREEHGVILSTIIYEAGRMRGREIHVADERWQTPVRQEALAGVFLHEARARVLEAGHRDFEPSEETW